MKTYWFEVEESPNYCDDKYVVRFYEDNLHYGTGVCRDVSEINRFVEDAFGYLQKLDEAAKNDGK